MQSSNKQDRSLAQSDGATDQNPSQPDPSIAHGNTATAGVVERDDLTPESVGVKLANAVHALRALRLFEALTRTLLGHHSESRLYLASEIDASLDEIDALLNRAQTQAEREAEDLRASRANLRHAHAEVRRLNVGLRAPKPIGVTTPVPGFALVVYDDGSAYWSKDAGDWVLGISLPRTRAALAEQHAEATRG